MFKKKVADIIKTRFLFNIFSRKACRLWRNVEKCDTAGKATDNGAYPRIGHEGTGGDRGVGILFL